MCETPPRILVVDDDESVGFSLMALLEDRGFDVIWAQSAEAAQTLLDQTPRDIAIVDLRLPGINGDAFIIQTHQIHPDLKFFIYTGSMDFELSPALRVAGVTSESVIKKPVTDIAELVTALRRQSGVKNAE
jgi:DNA-binding NtrC family response regulator